MKAAQDLLDQLHGIVAKEFIQRIASGEAKSADLAAAVKFLSDNGVKHIQQDDDSGLKRELDKLLPFKPITQLADEMGLTQD
jgi:hypothetical protein